MGDLFRTPAVVGGGRRSFPDGIRLELELVGQRDLTGGLLHAHHRTR